MADTIVVTGGAGFIGSSFVRHLLAQTDARVVVLDKLTYAGNLETLADVARDPRFTFVRGAVEDRADVTALFEAYRPSAVVNIAAETHVDRSIDDPDAFVRTNVVGTFELLRAAQRHHRELPEAERKRFRFLQLSTDEVFGSLDEGPAFSETTAYAPSSPYAATKAGADHLVRAYHTTFGLPALTTSSSNNYGPYQYPEKLVPLVTLNALEGRDLPIYGDGGNVRDWLFVEDHCAGLLLALRHGLPGETYNLGGGSERTNLEVVDGICDALEGLLPARENAAMALRGKGSYAELKTFVPDRPGHDRRYAIDASKIRAELGWQPAHDLASGLATTVRWYVSHRAWCDAVQSGKAPRERLGLLPERTPDPPAAPPRSPPR